MPLKTSWLFPIIQSIHLCGIALLVGSIAILDFRILGLVLRDHDTSALSRRFVPWKRTGLIVMLTTGPILFASDVARYSHNPAFLFKMAILLVALIHNRTEHRTKVSAFISLALWTCVVLGGRAIADFDI